MDTGPVEALHPVLKAIALLEDGEETQLLDALGAAVVKDARLADRPPGRQRFVDDRSGPRQMGEVARHRLSTRLSLIGGRSEGVGRRSRPGAGVSQRRGARNHPGFIGRYRRHRARLHPSPHGGGGWCPRTGWPPSTPLLPSDEPVFDLEVVFQDRPVKIRVRPMKGPEGNPVYLFRDNPGRRGVFHETALRLPRRRGTTPPAGRISPLFSASPPWPSSRVWKRPGSACWGRPGVPRSSTATTPKRPWSTCWCPKPWRAATRGPKPWRKKSRFLNPWPGGSRPVLKPTPTATGRGTPGAAPRIISASSRS
jgi:hypothetical protein